MKSETQTFRSKCSSAAVEIDPDKNSVTDRSSFMMNYANKVRFINTLSQTLTACSITVVQAKADADTTIANTALDEEVNVAEIADDTDILCLLVHGARAFPLRTFPPLWSRPVFPP